MAKSSLKIVLVDPLGDVLFCGDSLIGAVLDEEAAGRETRAATVSGIYPRRRAGDEVEPDADVKEEEAQPAKDVRRGIPPLKWRVRAA